MRGSPSWRPAAGAALYAAAGKLLLWDDSSTPSSLYWDHSFIAVAYMKQRDSLSCP